MPQLDLYSIFNQFFWGSFFFGLFYYLITFIFVPTFFTSLYARKAFSEIRTQEIFCFVGAVFIANVFAASAFSLLFDEFEVFLDTLIYSRVASSDAYSACADYEYTKAYDAEHLDYLRLSPLQ
jgi:hypothetical protein